MAWYAVRMLMATVRMRIYAFGMLACGYAAGQRNGDGGSGYFSGLPWWGTMMLGSALLVGAFVADWRAADKIDRAKLSKVRRAHREPCGCCGQRSCTCAPDIPRGAQ